MSAAQAMAKVMMIHHRPWGMERIQIKQTAAAPM
jgi:hypothetical protein